ncbi:hypothetical protein CRUP_036966, partial [Coryphaenoides rupestris]
MPSSSGLRRLSDNCGGKVVGVSQGTAVLRSAARDAAERACKRMENEDVFGYRIRPSFLPATRTLCPRTLCPAGSVPSRPVHLLFAPGAPPMPLPPLPVTQEAAAGARPWQTAGPLAEGPTVPGGAVAGPPGGPSAKPLQLKLWFFARIHLVQELGDVEANPKMVFQLWRIVDSALERLPKPGLIGESMYRRRADSSSPLRAVQSPMERGGRSSPEFLVSTPSAFSKLNLHHRSFSPLERLPCLFQPLLPLLPGPRSPGPDSPMEVLRDGPEVQVANLDYRMSRKELQQMLCNTFSRYGRLKATVQMVSVQQAISAVSRLHRYKIGGKRIHVSLATGGSNKSLATLRFCLLVKTNGALTFSVLGRRLSCALLSCSSEIIGILHDAPANCLPLAKFTELYEKRYSRRLVPGDLHRLPDVVAVRDQGGARLVCLLSSSQARQSPLGACHQAQEVSSSAGSSPVVFEELEYHEPVCRQHSALQNFSEADFDPDSYKLPFVGMSLRAIASQVHSLLQSHDATLPLLSFPECYAAEFGPLELGDETQEGAVSLEHLITCIPSITVVTAQNGFKVIKWIHNKPPAPNSEPWIHRSKSPVGNPQLIQFSREVIDLLKSKPACLLPVSKFIPSYHHHFAKQCRVSDYGYSKLLELLGRAVPHVLQRTHACTHTHHTPELHNRFLNQYGETKPLTGWCRVLNSRPRGLFGNDDQLAVNYPFFQILGMGTKAAADTDPTGPRICSNCSSSRASKQVAIKDFLQAYHWCFSRDWRVTDYGVCDLMDLLNEMPDTTVTMTRQDSDLVISVERTKQFGKEVVDLLRHQPHCRMPFSKFIPTYHHHFGRQCKLTFYGFAKLLDLFDAIPEVLTVLECGEEKVLTLTEVERVKALAAQLVKLLRSQRNCSLPVGLLLAEYGKTFGYGLRLQDYDAASLPSLLAKLCHAVKVVDGADGQREVQLINRKSLRLLSCQLLVLLMAQEEEPAGVSVEELSGRYRVAHIDTLNPCEYGFLSLSELLKSLPYLVEVSGEGEVSMKLVARSNLKVYQKDVCQDCDSPSGGGCGGEVQRTEDWVRLTRLYQFARGVRGLLLTYHYHQIFLTEFAAAYSKFTGRCLQPHSYGYTGVDELLAAIPQHEQAQQPPAALSHRVQVLPARLTQGPVPQWRKKRRRRKKKKKRRRRRKKEEEESELMHLTSPLDLLCGPVPSCLPSPQLHPHPVHTDLIHFETSPPLPDGSEVEAPAAPDVEGPAGGVPSPANPATTAKSMESPNKRALR